MKIILKKEVANLGEAGEVVNVKTGYALNYLVPQGFATIATPSALKQHEETIRQRAHKEAKIVADAQAFADKLSAMNLTIPVKVNAEGKIFGSVTAKEIAQALEEQGYTVDKHAVALKDPIKQLGRQMVDIKLYNGLSARINVVVEADK